LGQFSTVLGARQKRDEDVNEGTTNCSNKKKNKQRQGGSLVVDTKQKGGRVPIEGTPDHFEKLLEGLCLNHAFPVKHMYKDYALMKRFLSSGSKKGDREGSPSRWRTTLRRTTTVFW
jgi:hypothetical protein